MKSPLLIALITGIFLASLTSAAQDSASADTPQAGVVLVKVSPPVYPPLARQAHISGDVKLDIHIRADGSVSSVDLFSGHPILATAAVDSAKKSQFECRRCNEDGHSYSLTYAFKVADSGNCCTAHERLPEVTQSSGLITISAPALCICDPAASITRLKRRSAKCLYLWRCASRVIDLQ